MAHAFFFHQQLHMPLTAFAIVHNVEQMISGAHRAIFEQLTQLKIGNPAIGLTPDNELFLSVFKLSELLLAIFDHPEFVPSQPADA
jgi:hypothetical protein